MVRLFVAIDLPSSIREDLFNILSSFDGFKLKRVSSELIHVTIKFLGDVPDHMVPDVITSLDTIKMFHFDANLRNIGVFPNLSSPRVIWVGVEGNFKQLHDDVEDTLSKLGFSNDTKMFTAHATLARIKHLPATQKNDFLAILDSLKCVDIGCVKVNKISLKKSTLTPSGPIHDTIHEVLLE